MKEKRSALRNNLSINVVIHHDIDYVARWKTKNLSMHGVLVDMPGEDLFGKSMVETVLEVKTGGKTERFCLPANIVRMTTNDVALKFAGYGDKTYSALSNILSENQ
jgi:hypothetical protein